MNRLRGKVAIITGAGRGMGREIALAYAEEGAHLALAARTLAEVEAVAAEVRALGQRAVALQVDATVVEDVQRMVAETLRELGQIDVLVANAGIGTGAVPPEHRLIVNARLIDWERQVAANTTSVLLACREVLPHMMARRSGVILSHASTLRPGNEAGRAVYLASKMAQVALIRALAEEVKEYGIRANAFDPGGAVYTRSSVRYGDPAAEASSMKPSVVRAVALYLASDESKEVTGQHLTAVEFNRQHGITC